MHIGLFIKVIYWIQILLNKKNNFILLFLQSYFFDEQSKFLILPFIITKGLNIDSFTNENKNKLKGHRFKFLQIADIPWII